MIPLLSVMVPGQNVGSLTWFWSSEYFSNVYMLQSLTVLGNDSFSRSARLWHFLFLHCEEGLWDCVDILRVSLGGYLVLRRACKP